MDKINEQETFLVERIILRLKSNVKKPNSSVSKNLFSENEKILHNYKVKRETTT